MATKLPPETPEAQTSLDGAPRAWWRFICFSRLVPCSGGGLKGNQKETTHFGDPILRHPCTIHHKAICLWQTSEVILICVDLETGQAVESPSSHGKQQPISTPNSNLKKPACPSPHKRLPSKLQGKCMDLQGPRLFHILNTKFKVEPWSRKMWSCSL